MVLVRLVLTSSSLVQGNKLRDFYYYVKDGLKKDPGWFQIAFENVKGIKYCDKSLGCKNGA